ncbi:MAG: hypothetical protein L0H53_14155, partial [Candidatus Nitrosocosmicus sp.]|nr:hypothetical protein [Candidatus Nitrosocosmicus sp.]
HVRFLLSDEIEIEPTSFNDIIFRYSMDPYKILKRKLPNLIPSVVSTLLHIEQNDAEMKIEMFAKEFMKNSETMNLIEKINQTTDNKVDELEITVKTKDRLEAITDASRKAHLICNYLSYKYKDSIVPTYSGSTLYKNNMPCGTEATKFFTVFTLTKITITNEIDTIDTNPHNYDYSYYNRALRAAKNLDFSGAIRDFYQIIENNVNELQHLNKYSSLRDLLSHSKITYQTTKDKLKTDFPEIKTVNDRFDYSSSENFRYLRLHCDYLRYEIFNFLNR